MIAHPISSLNGIFLMMNHAKSLIRENNSFWLEDGGISRVVAV